ncbi:MAG: hypothetical protein WC205_09220 [Opitutaceae bacterium]|jgi:hypothetical protein
MFPDAQFRSNRGPIPNCGGFALLITITLLAFLVLLLVAFAQLTRVETMVATNMQTEEQARQNAFMALQIALGQLQLHAGPDQRTTVTADILGDANGNATSADGTRYWTGVSGNSAEPGDSFAANPSPVLLNWLVSGNEATPGFSASATGRITAAPAAGDIPFVPSTTVNGLAVADAMSDGLTLSSGEAVRLLVGPGTVNDKSGYVVAPLQSVQTDNVPGLLGSQPIGRYAWWVGDEGVKAKYSLTDPYSTHTGTGDTEGRYRALAAQSQAIELMPGMGSYPVSDRALLGKLVTLSQTQLADSSSGVTAFKQLHHDLTVASFGLLTNSRSGGLRRDLTGYLAQGGLTGDIIPGSVFPSGQAPLGPRWEMLKSWSDLAAESSPLAIRSATDMVHGITPVIVQLKFFIGLHIESDGRCHVRTWPAVVLGNPYSMAITGSADVKIISAGYPYARFQVDGAEKFRAALATSSGGGFLGGIDFRIADVNLGPGEVKAFFPDLAAGVVQNSGVVPMGTSFYPDVWVAYDTGVNIDPPVAGTDWKWTNLSGGEVSVELRVAGTTDVLQGVYRIGEPGTSVATTLTPPTGLAGGYDYAARGYTYTLKSARPSASPVRPFADYNLRAQSIYRSTASGAGFSTNALYVSGSVANFSAFTLNAEQPRWGRAASLTDGKERIVLFDVPRRSSVDEAALLSLGQLQHVSATADNAYVSTVWQPGHAIGNSRANPFVSRERSFEQRTFGASSEMDYDMSYLLNTALWDGYFFSTVPQSSGSTFVPGTASLPDARLIVKGSVTPTLTEIRQPERAARWLMIDGAFNVNSTSEEAWAAVLSGLRELSINGDSGLVAPFPRSIRQPGGSASSADGQSDNAYDGFRDLTQAQIRDPATGDGLARKIVREIRRRGPFVSLAQFVNRRLVSSSDTDAGQGLSGVIQTAIDRMGLNSGFPSDEYITAANLTGAAAYADTEAALGARAAGIPGWLSQADVLQSLAPSLASRSDTFVIRAYGEILDPVNSTKANPVITGRAWCEAVVQRMPDFVETGNNAWDLPSALSAENQRFGRRFQIVSFRWLSADDI